MRDRPETKRLVLGSAVGRAGVGTAPAGGVGTKGKVEEAEFEQKKRRKTRGAATAALVAMAAGLSLKVKPWWEIERERSVSRVEPRLLFIRKIVMMELLSALPYFHFVETLKLNFYYLIFCMTLLMQTNFYIYQWMLIIRTTSRVTVTQTFIYIYRKIGMRELLCALRILLLRRGFN